MLNEVAHKRRIGKRNASKRDLSALGMSTCRKPLPYSASDHAFTNTATKLLTNVAFLHYSIHALRCYIILFLCLIYPCSYSPVLQVEAGLESIITEATRMSAADAPQKHLLQLYLHALLRILLANKDDHRIFEEPHKAIACPCSFADVHLQDKLFPIACSTEESSKVNHSEPCSEEKCADLVPVR